MVSFILTYLHLDPINGSELISNTSQVTIFGNFSFSFAMETEQPDIYTQPYS